MPASRRELHSHHTAHVIVSDKVNSKNHSKQLGIMYWNVNGLGDKMGEKDFVDILLRHDVIILSETMKRPSLRVSFPGFVVQNFPHSTHHRCKKRTPGGFIVFIRDELYKNVKVVKVKDHVIWICLSNKLVDSDKDLYLGAVYIPHEHSKVRLNGENYFDMLADDISKYRNTSNTLLIGDWNARVAQLKDHIPRKCLGEMENYLDTLPVENERENIDTIINNASHSLINLCKSTGMQILDGLLFKTSSDRYSCWRYNGCSRVDHVIADSLVMRTIEGLEISPRNINSDHSYLAVQLRKMCMNTKEGSSQNSQPIHRFQWDSIMKHQYCKDLNSKACNTFYQQFLFNIIDEDIGHAEVIESFYNFIGAAIKPNFKRTKSNTTSKFPMNAWFDADCKIAKSKLHMEVKLNPHNPIIQPLKKEYRRLIQRKKESISNQLQLN